MNIPGSNLLSLALRVVTPQGLAHSAFIGRTANGAGDYVDAYADPEPIQGSMQAVDRKLYQAMGLNFSKNYSTLFTTADVKPTTRDRVGDRLTYAGRIWLAESDLDWSTGDGWRKLLCVEVPA